MSSPGAQGPNYSGAGPGGAGNSDRGYKVCPRCGGNSALTDQICARCGHQYRQNFAPPPPTGPGQPGPFNQTQAFYGQSNTFGPGAYGAGAQASNPQYLAELARQFIDARKVFLWTFWGGMFCLWPLWIVAYLEYTKMRNIKKDVASMGLDVRWWQLTFGARDAF